MAKAVWNGAVLADSPAVVWVEGSAYFPPDSVNWEFFEESSTVTRCPWKGNARYYHVSVDGLTNRDAAWVYPETTEEAEHFRDHLAFWKGVQIEE